MINCKKVSFSGHAVQRMYALTGSDPDKFLFLQKILPESGAKKVLGCAFWGQKGVFKVFKI